MENRVLTSSQLSHRLRAMSIACSLALVCDTALCGQISSLTSTTVEDALSPLASKHSISFNYANFDVPIAGVAGGEEVVFVGEPLKRSVVALSRFTGNQIGELPPPPNGFAVPFIIHSLGKGKVAVLDAGGFHSPRLSYQPVRPSTNTHIKLSRSRDSPLA